MSADPNDREIPEPYLDAALAQLPDADEDDVTERALELWAQDRADAQEYEGAR